MGINRDKLKKDLLELDIKEFYIKYIVKSYNWYFAEYLKIPSEEIIDEMDRFKEIVSNYFKISFHSLQMVGSAKTGFSLSPRKVLSPFHDEEPNGQSSDIDIAIVSEQWYSKLWNMLRKTEKIQYKKIYKDLTIDIFRGYINEKSITEINGIRRMWKELVSPINQTLQDELSIVHPITYRIYRNWEDLEEYQVKGILKTRAKLEEM